MNEKMINDITDFFNDVGDYLSLEYNPKIHKKFFDDSKIDQHFDMIAKYYMGGNNVSDTAGMMAEYLRGKNA